MRLNRFWRMNRVMGNVARPTNTAAREAFALTLMAVSRQFTFTFLFIFGWRWLHVNLLQTIYWANSMWKAQQVLSISLWLIWFSLWLSGPPGGHVWVFFFFVFLGSFDRFIRVCELSYAPRGIRMNEEKDVNGMREWEKQRNIFVWKFWFYTGDAKHGRFSANKNSLSRFQITSHTSSWTVMIRLVSFRHFHQMSTKKAHYYPCIRLKQSLYV